MKHPLPLLPTQESARRLGVSRQRVLMMAKRYGIVLTRVGQSCYMTEADLALLLKRQGANERAAAQPKRNRG